MPKRKAMTLQPQKLLRIAGTLLVLTGGLHTMGHFVMKGISEEARMANLVLGTFRIRVAGGSMSVPETLDGLNVFYGIFLVFSGTLALWMTHTSNNQKAISGFLIVNIITWTTAAIIALVFFLWIHVAYFTIFLLLFGAAWMVRKKPTYKL